MITLIAAIGKNRELGLNNELIWHLKKDMAFFRSTTLNHTVVMGRKTYESISKPLPNRENIVITHSKIDDVKTVANIDEILKLAGDREIFIIGGASIYGAFMPHADRIYLTLIDDSHECDTYFPEINYDLFDEKILENGSEDGIEYKITLYERKSS